MWLNLLLVFVPVTVGLEYLAKDQHTLIFAAACLAIIPLAGWMGRATEQIAEKTGEGVGGLLNATFGNAAELIIALVALQKGLYDVVKASLTGSIIGNVLLVLGASILAGGLKHKEQKFNAQAASSQSTLLTLAAIALIIPAAFHLIGGTAAQPREAELSLEIAIVLVIIYALHLVFSLHTHKQLFLGESVDVEEIAHGAGHWSMKKSIAILAGSTAMVAWMSEILVGSVEATAHALRMPQVFIGVIVVAIVGNAAEHSTAILVAMKNRMDLALSIAIGSSIQIALFVAPVLIFASYFIGPQPMDLLFTSAEILAIVLAVWITHQICSDGLSNWIEGVQLLAVYILLGIVFYLLPSGTAAGAH
jgi:Ca2+:H+ antiporter